MGVANFEAYKIERKSIMKNEERNILPEISVIMGIYNCADTLKDAIESILAQTIEDWELIMCDDGSQDGTYETALAYALQ